MWSLPNGEDFLPKTSMGRLRGLYTAEPNIKPKLRLLCAIHRKEGKSLDAIADKTRMKRRTVHETLWRFIDRGVEGKDSIKQDGRPSRLTRAQQKQLMKALEKGPPNNSSGLWTTKGVKELINKKYGITYTNQHVWELLIVAGFSLQTPRPRNYKAPNKAEIRYFKKRLHIWRKLSAKKDT
jgi:transposase